VTESWNKVLNCNLLVSLEGLLSDPHACVGLKPAFEILPHSHSTGWYDGRLLKLLIEVDELALGVFPRPMDRLVQLLSVAAEVPTDIEDQKVSFWAALTDVSLDLLALRVFVYIAFTGHVKPYFKPLFGLQRFGKPLCLDCGRGKCSIRWIIVCLLLLLCM